MTRRGVFRPFKWDPQAFMMVALFLVVAVLGSSTPSLGSQDFFPREIQGLEMGSDYTAVIERIKDSGTYTMEEVPKGPRCQLVLGLPTGSLMRRVVIRDQKRTQLVWTPPPGSYYQTVTFLFTEKRRLYLIRFALADSRRDGLKLKKSFFDKFEFPEETPMRLTRTHSDILLYGPAKSKDFFFEFTDTRTGQKSFELFRREISGQDRPLRKAPARKKAEGRSSPEAGRDPGPQQQQPPAANAPSESTAQPETITDSDKSPRNGTGAR